MADFQFGRLGTPITIDAWGAVSFNSFAIDQSGDRIEFIFQASEPVVITKLGFRYGLRTGVPVQHRISLQGVGMTGNPDGTVKGGGNPASATFTPPADATWDGTVQWIALSNNYSAAKGEWLSIVIEPVGTPDGSNCSAFSVSVANTFIGRAGTPYVISNNSGSRTRTTTSALMYGYQSASRAYGTLIVAQRAVAFSSDSTPDEYALAFAPKAEYGATYRIAGIRANVTAPVAGKTVRIALYSGTTTLAQTMWDSDCVALVAAATRIIEAYWSHDADGNPLGELPALAFGSVYRIGFQPQETEANVALTCLELKAAGDRTAFAGGDDYWLSSRVDGGGWEDDLTQRPLVELILAEWAEPTSGAGGISRGRQVLG